MSEARPLLATPCDDVIAASTITRENNINTNTTGSNGKHTSASSPNNNNNTSNSNNGNGRVVRAITPPNSHFARPRSRSLPIITRDPPRKRWYTCCISLAIKRNTNDSSIIGGNSLVPRAQLSIP
jgi:hypothetical protein